MATDDDNTVFKNLIITLLAVVAVIIAVMIYLCFCCRTHLDKCLAHMVNQVGPEEDIKGLHVRKFGETKIKYVEAKISDYMTYNSREQYSDTGRQYNARVKVKWKPVLDCSTASNTSMSAKVESNKGNGGSLKVESELQALPPLKVPLRFKLQQKEE